MSLTDTQTRPTTTPGTTSPQAEPGKALTLREAVEEFQVDLVARRNEYAPALPSHISADKFQRVVVTAVNLNPDLLRASRLSLFNACAKAASDGLLPDGRDGALVIFNSKDGKDAAGKDRWVKKVQWMPMVAGIIKKARQSGEISALGARIVYAKEIEQNRFVHKVVDGVPKVDHDPILWGERGAMVLVYSFVRFKDGSVDFEFLHADDVAKMRAVSKSKNGGPWTDWTEEMWKKSAIRRHAKRLPVSAELFDTIARDDEMTEFERQRAEAEKNILENARRQLGAPAHDLETGEIHDGQGGDSEDGEEDGADDEGPLDRGKRLLALCTDAYAVADLQASITDELAAEDHADWLAMCDTARASMMAGKKK